MRDSTFNFAFIADAFSSDKPKDTTSTSGGGSTFNLQLNRINLHHITCKVEDSVGSTGMLGYIADAEILINKIDLSDHILALEKVQFEQTAFTLRSLYDTIPSVHADSYDTVHIALGGWDLEASALVLDDCRFQYVNENSEKYAKGIDFNHLDLSHIQMEMTDIVYAGDTIQARIEQIGLQERSGFLLDTLMADVLFSPYEITLQDMVLATGNSHIRDGFSMTFSTLNDFDRFTSSVRMNGHFVHSSISSEDIAYFAPVLDDYNAQLQLDAHIYGSIDNLKGRDFVATLNDAVGIQGELNLRGLPNIDETFLDLDFDPLFVRTYQLENIIGYGKLPEEIRTMGTIDYTGKMTGFLYDIVSYGNLKTDIGAANTDVHFTYDAIHKGSQFEGSLNTSAFNVGKLIGQEQMVGKVSMEANINGSLNKGNEADVHLDANVQSLALNGYTYTGMQINGAFKNNYFSGDINIDDPNIVMQFAGVVDFTDTIPVYNFTSKISRANLQQLNLYEQPVVFSATASMDASGKTIDDMRGEAHFGDLYFIRGRNIYILDTLSMFAGVDSGKNYITGQSNLLDFSFKGNYTLTKLPAAVNELIRYYTNGISDTTLAPQQAEFSINIKNADRLMAIFYEDIHTIRNAVITGDFNTAQHTFNSRSRMDAFAYKGYKLDTILLETQTEGDMLQFFTRVRHTESNGKELIPITTAEGSFAHNTLQYNLKVGKDIDPNRLNLNGEIAFMDSLMAFNILPSEIYYRNEKWNILPNNSLQIDGKNIIANNFTLTSGEKLISLNTVPDEKYQTVLKLDIQHFPIDEIADKYILPGEGLKGVLDAHVNIGDLTGDFSFLGGGTISDLYLQDQKIGDLSVNAFLVRPSNKMSFKAYVAGVHGFTAQGIYTLANAETEDSIDLQVDFKDLNVVVAQPFLSGILSDLDGDINGGIHIAGAAQHPLMEGNVKVTNGSAVLDYMGTKYYFPELIAEIAPNKITIPETSIQDKLHNNGTLEGEVAYSNFSGWNFRNFHFTSDHILLMQTTAQQNPDFNGYAIGSADVNITGTLDDINIKIEATPHDSTVVNLPTYGSGNVKKHDFIRFVDRSNPNVDKEDNSLNLSVVNVDLLLNATPNAEIKILINSEGTEYLSGKGFGTLNIKASSLGKVEMTGDYTISEGTYDFSFQGLFQRPFTVEPGGTITFNGDPYKADLDLTAVYTAKKVKTSTVLASGVGEDVDVNVLINIGGKLEAPEISFDLDIPKTTAGASNTELQRWLQQVKADQNELNKQVFGLLITTSFLPQDLTAFNAVGTTANSTLNDFVSAQLTTYFQNVLNDFLKDTEIDVGYDNIQSGSYNYTNDQGYQFDVILKREIANNLIVKVGTTYYDYASANADGSTNNLAGDFEVEYLITEDGRIRVKAFRTSEYDAIVAKNDVKTGVGLYYTKDFDKIGDIFKKKE
ncbi:MAG: translocation/assembly module TamB domain-containing protein [Chitinophagales bacterium]